jgi:hypothetical protein
MNPRDRRHCTRLGQPSAMQKYMSNFNSKGTVTSGSVFAETVCQSSSA